MCVFSQFGCLTYKSLAGTLSTLRSALTTMAISLAALLATPKICVPCLLISSLLPTLFVPPRHSYVLFLIFRFPQLLGMQNSLSHVGYPPKKLWNSTISVKLLGIISSSSLEVAKPPTLLKQIPTLKCMPYDGFVFLFAAFSLCSAAS